MSTTKYIIEIILKENNNLLKDFLNIINVLAVIVGVCIAYNGLNTWKKQLKGSDSYNLAKKILRNVFNIRESIKSVRNPAIWVAEQEAALIKKGFNQDDIKDRNKTRFAVYSVRWDNVIKHKVELDSLMIEVEVMWGKESVFVFNNLINHINKLYLEINNFLDKDRSEKVNRGIIYYRGDNEDTFNIEINSIITDIEALIGPYLK